MFNKIMSAFAIASEAVFANKVRSLLTGLGIIFGVAAVIAMLAIGSGAQEEILEQIKLVGVNNVVITPVVEQSEGEVAEEGAVGAKEKKNLSLGLNFLDVRSIQKIIPDIEMVSPEIVLDTEVTRQGFRRTSKLVGVTNAYFEISGFKLDEGSFFNEQQLEKGKPVCIIGKAIKAKFFSREEPIGKYIKVGRHWLKVVGVLEERLISEKSISNLGIRDYNMDIYTPLSAALIRYENRLLVTNALIQEARRNNNNNNNQGNAGVNYHQLDRLVLKVSNTEQMSAIAEVVSKILNRKHNRVVDFEITIPELLLKQQQRTKNIFNIVLGGIAGISLLVGGIGIMNIMLASVLERIKEIGLRLSLGATKIDIIYQFLLEAVMISFSGGAVGVVFGLSAAYAIAELADIPTIVSMYSILLSFGVAVTVGVIFGIAPARRAASQDPITSLRYE